MGKSRSFKELDQLKFGEITIPLEIHHEWRQSARVSISRNKAIVRLPILVANSTREQHLSWAKDWILKKLRKDHNLLNHFHLKDYQSGQQITVRNTVFTLDVKVAEGRSSASGKRIGRTIFITLPSGLDPTQKNKVCSHIIHKVMSRTYLHHLQRRVTELNDLYFNMEVNEIRLRNNTSNWGSCSSNKNISISSRLLLAPDFVLDYIIIHELAHLVHHNHSAQFWALVASVMPDYMKAENWISSHGGSINW
ncbi:MAG: M48 family metallopeptidase [Saprospiraceae bacterium]|nr:M48 family metallopeptidase [Saprospiraceae bacterium]HMW38472.1 M48 family metallopeptidase [Saprospiraceae bacterium]HMX87558.1 M48 family metallopeptidase [Saprospiraceae bacterium]HMZ39564.1 M48 family metallopeptidase [Saprospiraceae bacterium]HNA64209.1 M48 family metallopeptidase [Saprospiraceae bacterium]